MAGAWGENPRSSLRLRGDSESTDLEGSGRKQDVGRLGDVGSVDAVVVGRVPVVVVLQVHQVGD